MKEFLSQKGISFEEKDVSRDRQAAQEMVDRTGQMGVPVIVIDGETIIGFDRPRIEQALSRRPAQSAGKASLGASVADSRGRAGALVGRVRPGSAAARVGLQPNDIIIKLNRQPVNNLADLQKAIGEIESGSHIMVYFMRDGRETAGEGIL